MVPLIPLRVIELVGSTANRHEHWQHRLALSFGPRTLMAMILVASLWPVAACTPIRTPQESQQTGDVDSAADLSPNSDDVNPVADVSPAPVPTQTADLAVGIPHTSPEYEAFVANVVAEIEVAEVYSARANNDSGIIPTRVPSSPFGANPPGPAKDLYIPYRVTIEHLYKNDGPPMTGIMLAQYLRTEADYQPSTYDGDLRGLRDASSIQVGDTGIVFLRRTESIFRSDRLLSN